MKARLSAKAFPMTFSFVCILVTTNFHNKNFALSLAVIMSFTATRKWCIVHVHTPFCMKIKPSCKKYKNQLIIISLRNENMTHCQSTSDYHPYH